MSGERDSTTLYDNLPWKQHETTNVKQKLVHIYETLTSVMDRDATAMVVMEDQNANT